VQPPRTAACFQQWHDAFRALPQCQASTQAATSTEGGEAGANIGIDKQSDGIAADIDVLIPATEVTTGKADIATRNTTTASHSHFTVDSDRTTASAASHSRCTNDPARTTTATAPHSCSTIDST